MSNALIYLGYQPSGNETIANDLRERGINYLRASPDEIPPFIMTTSVSPGYAYYASNLPGYMSCFVSGRDMELNPDHYYPNQNVVSLPIAPPQLAIEFTRVDSHLSGRMNELGFHTTKLNGKVVYVIESYEVDDISSVLKDDRAITTCPTPFNGTNITGLSTFIFCSRLAHAYFITQRYPSNIRLPESEREEEGSTLKRVRLETTGEPIAQPEMSSSLAPSTSKKMRSIKAPTIEDNELYRYFGTVSDIPDLPGVMIVYEKELAKPDSKTIYKVIADYFLKSLGSTEAKCLDKIDSIMSGLGTLGNCASGMILTHIFYCINVSIKAQCRPFMIIEGGVYNGCVMLGSQFKMMINKRVYTAIQHHNLIGELENLTTHQNTLAQLCEELELDILTVTSMRIISRAVKVKEMSESSRSIISKKVKFLKFKQSYWGMNPDRVLEALDLLAHPSREIDDEVPMHHSALFATDRETLVLSAFGTDAPTVNIDGATKIMLNSSSNYPSKLVARKVPLIRAVQDYRNIQNTQIFHNDPKFTNKTYTAREFKNQEVVLIMSKLRSYAGTQQSSSSSSSVRVIIEQERDLPSDW